MSDRHPKVLFVTPCAFNKITGGGITFSNLFQDWPKDKLATVTNDPVAVSRDICNQYFFLTSRELSYIRPFSFLKSIKKDSLGDAEPVHARGNTGRSSWVLAAGRQFIGEAGIPDRGTLSENLKAWIHAFRPEVLYTVLGSPGYIDLVHQIQDEFSLPLAIHLMDDGVTDPRKKGFFGSYLRFLYRRKFQRVLGKATLAMGICEAMAKEYSLRYRVPFRHFQNVVDLERWERFAKKDVTLSAKPRIVYAGSIFKNAQLQSLLDCCRAVKRLNQEGVAVGLDVFAPKELFSDPLSALKVFPDINVSDIPENDEDYFSLLGKADVLLLPVNFDSASVDFLRLSMPTKVPSYLASGTPILVYGPQGVAQVEYARDSGWGRVVDRQGIDALASAVRHMIGDSALRQALSTKAKEAARENHDAKKVRGAFHDALCHAAFQDGCPETR
jgi:glycosyltransferase involved in cell wall biosynthesis